MRRIENILNLARGIITYELADGQRIDLDATAVHRHGAAELIRAAGLGHLLPTERMKVIQNGRHIGTVPPDFNPIAIKSRSFLYDPRPGDFQRDGDTWIASPSLGNGDLEAIPGFAPTPEGG